MKKIITATFLFVVIVALTASAAIAATITRDQSKVDETLADQSSKQYAQPGKILLTRITTDSEELRASSKNWFKAVYYYSITRLGYVDIPFTYVLDRDGDIYDGREGGVEVAPETLNSEGLVLIGYLSNSSDITPVSEAALKDLIEDISYKYGVGKENVQAVSINRVVSENGVSKTTYEELEDKFADEVNEIVDSMTLYGKEHIEYTAEITNLKFESTVKAGEKLKVSFGLVNKDKHPWFTNVNPIYLSTEDGSDSPFAVNGVWDSFSKPLAITDKTILPGETVNLEFDLQALLLPGKQKTSFKVMKLPDNSFKNGSFKVNFEVTKGDFDLVQVSGTPGGILNVRTCPSGNCESVSQVSEGQIFVTTEESVGWYKIKYAEGKEGWIYGPYVIEL